LPLLCGGAWVVLRGGFLKVSVSHLISPFDVYYRGLGGQGRLAGFPSVSDLFVPLTPLLLLCLVFSVVALMSAWRGRAHICFGSVSVTALLLLVLVQGILIRLEPFRSVKGLAQQVRATAGPHDLLVHEGPLEESASLPFYTGRRILVVNGQRGDLDFGSRFPEGRDLFLTPEAFRDLWRGERRVFFVTPFPLAVSVLRTLEWEEVFPLGSQGFRHLSSNRGA